MFKQIAVLVLLGGCAQADGFYVYGGVNAFDDKAAQPEYNIQSPTGVYGLYFQHDITSKLDIKAGLEHMTSIPTKEEGAGLNMVTLKLTLKLF